MSNLALQRTSTRDISDEALQELIEKNRDVHKQYFDETYLNSIAENLFTRLAPSYFRPKFIGFENYPTKNNPDAPLIFASNHSGMAFPWDAMVFGCGMYKVCSEQNVPTIRVLSAPVLSETPLMNPYMIPDLWKRVGGVDATSLNFETVMVQNEMDVLIYPEGVPGIGKGFNRKYQLQRFSTSFIRMALKYKTDIFPVYSINGEYINPYSYRWKGLNSLMQKIGIPYLPIGFLTLLIPFFPWMFYFGLPAGFYFVMGKRIEPNDFSDKPFEEMTKEDIEAVRDKVHELMQAEITVKVKEYGQKPYNWKELWKAWRVNKKDFWGYFPMTWCLIFAEHERQYKRFQKTGEPVKLQSGFGAIFSWLWYNPFFIFYLIPVLGWIPLIIRGYSNTKKPKK